MMTCVTKHDHSLASRRFFVCVGAGKKTSGYLSQDFVDIAGMLAEPIKSFCAYLRNRDEVICLAKVWSGFL